MIKPGLTVHRLELFLAVLDHGGVGRAAQACHISQPAVSEHLRELEAHFGVRLVERHGRRARPTAAARGVEPYARQALALLRTAGLAAEPWVQDELVLIVPRGHAFARRRAVTARAIAGESYIAREEGSSTRGVAERYLARLGVTLTPAMELGSTEAIREAVAAGLGVALVSHHAVLARDRRIVAARLAGPRWTRDLLIVRRAGTPLGPAAAA